MEKEMEKENNIMNIVISKNIFKKKENHKNIKLN